MNCTHAHLLRISREEQFNYPLVKGYNRAVKITKCQHIQKQKELLREQISHSYQQKYLSDENIEEEKNKLELDMIRDHAEEMQENLQDFLLPEYQEETSVRSSVFKQYMKAEELNGKGINIYAFQNHDPDIFDRVISVRRKQQKSHNTESGCTDNLQ